MSFGRSCLTHNGGPPLFLHFLFRQFTYTFTTHATLPSNLTMTRLLMFRMCSTVETPSLPPHRPLFSRMDLSKTCIESNYYIQYTV
jgi:hypothetical protein